MTENNNTAIKITDLFDTKNCDIQLSGNSFERFKKECSENQIIIDNFSSNNAMCVFFRSSTHFDESIHLTLNGKYRIHSCHSGGWVLLSEDGYQPSYWIPIKPKIRQIDQDAHILSENDANIQGISVSLQATDIAFFATKDQQLDFTIWKFVPHDNKNELIDFLLNPDLIETQAYYLWGSHTPYQRPADLYLHLIHGHIYENNYSWPHRWKICSENDAHALYVVLSGLQKATNSPIYSLLKYQILISIITRQSDNGAWLHGEWTGHMEAHFRLNASAIHLLMDAWEENNDPVVEVSLKKAVAFISQQKDTLDCGVWFLHDDLELSVDKMNDSPFLWLESRALGKSLPNMLVLNTHLDITILLDRYSKLTQDNQYDELITSANSSTKTVLTLRPAEAIYKAVFFLINLSLLPTNKAAALPLYLRALKRIGWKYLIPHLHHLKVRFPRFVMPGGYIDRAIPLESWAFHYLTINIMDLLRYKRRFKHKYLDQIIEDAMQCTYHSGVLERWQELDYEKYALGFWAEALYHQCTLNSATKYRKWLAEAILILEKMAMGIPPSLLGSNSEANAYASQVPCPLPGEHNIRVVNLCRENIHEYLVVNCGEVGINVTSLKFPKDVEIIWSDQENKIITSDLVTIPSFSWIHGINPISNN